MQDPVQLARELARIARQNQLAEIEYRSEPLRLRLTFEEKPARAVVSYSPGELVPSAAPSAVASAPDPAEPAPVAPAVSRPVIVSPLAGVFYRAPRPGSPPFVEVAQAVPSGATLCIVEAMKLMNEITAEGSLKIVKILAENGSVVENGQPLFEYEPLG